MTFAFLMFGDFPRAQLAIDMLRSRGHGATEVTFEDPGAAWRDATFLIGSADVLFIPNDMVVQDSGFADRIHRRIAQGLHVIIVGDANDDARNTFLERYGLSFTSLRIHDNRGCDVRCPVSRATADAPFLFKGIDHLLLAQPIVVQRESRADPLLLVDPTLDIIDARTDLYHHGSALGLSLVAAHSVAGGGTVMAIGGWLALDRDPFADHLPHPCLEQNLAFIGNLPAWLRSRSRLPRASTD